MRKYYIQDGLNFKQGKMIVLGFEDVWRQMIESVAWLRVHTFWIFIGCALKHVMKVMFDSIILGLNNVENLVLLLLHSTSLFMHHMRFGGFLVFAIWPNHAYNYLHGKDLWSNYPIKEPIGSRYPTLYCMILHRVR